MEAIIKTANGRKVYLILDNLKVHHSKLVTVWAEEHKAQVRDVGELEVHTSDFMQKLADDPDHVMAYFDHPVLEPYKLR